jgi:hypothetical protein
MRTKQRVWNLSWGMAIRGWARSHQGINLQIVLRTAESGAFMFLWEVALGAARHPIRSVSARERRCDHRSNVKHVASQYL